MLKEIDPSVPPGLVMAFYKGTRPGVPGFFNKIGRQLDHGPYSHTELILPEEYDRISVGSSYMDGGVRFKMIGYSSVGYWDFLPIPDFGGKLAKFAHQWTIAHNALSYDLKGNMRFFTNLAAHDENKWFCVESNMAQLGYPENHAFRFGPTHAAVTLGWYFGVEMVSIPLPSKAIQRKIKREARMALKLVKGKK